MPGVCVTPHLEHPLSLSRPHNGAGVVAPWTWEDGASYVRTHEGVLGYLDNYEFEHWFKQFSHTGGVSYFSGVLFFKANRTITLNITQPVISESGMIR